MNINHLTPRPDTNIKNLELVLVCKQREIKKRLTGIAMRRIVERCEALGIEDAYYYHQDDVQKQKLLCAVLRKGDSVSLYLPPIQEQMK